MRRPLLRGSNTVTSPAAAHAAAAAPPPPLVVRVKRELLAACMTCHLCHKLLNDATTISECLHTFCRECIFGKFNDEEVECCPMCKTDLGCVAVEKLRPDHNLQDVRAKIFPLKRKKVNAPEVLSVSLPVRRKERSLSSLVVTSPRVGTTTGLTGRRTKVFSRRDATLRGSSPAIDESIKKEDANDEYCAQNLNSPEIPNKISRNRRQNSSKVESSNNDTENGEPYLDKDEIWKPLNCLIEAAKLKSSQQSSNTKTKQIDGPDDDVHVPKAKARKHPNKSIIKDDMNGNSTTPSGLVKAKRLFGATQKRELATSTQALLDAAGDKPETRMGPIWFSLIAADDQHENAPLPQLSANFLRIKNRNLPASLLKKYLVKKLDLAGETEVDITCQGQPVDPTMALHGLVDMWLQEGSSHKVQASVGSSAKDFVVVLTYCRKAPVSSPHNVE